MIGSAVPPPRPPPMLPPQAEHEPLPRQSQSMRRDGHSPAARRLHRQASVPLATPTSMYRPLSGSDCGEDVQPPSYQEATERTSIVIDGGALQVVQGPSEGFSARPPERAAQQNRYPQDTLPTSSRYLPPQPSAPPAPAARLPLPPIPATENVVGPGSIHHRSSAVLSLYRSEPDKMDVAMRFTPGHIPARSAGSDTREGPRNKCNCKLEHDPQFRLSILGPHGGQGDTSLPMHAYPPQLAVHTAIPAHYLVLSEPVEVQLHLAHPQQTFSLLRQAPPGRRVGVVEPSYPSKSNGAAAESLHVDELNVGGWKPLSKMEKALLRRMEFGLKVDYSILRLS